MRTWVLYILLGVSCLMTACSPPQHDTSAADMSSTAPLEDSEVFFKSIRQDDLALLNRQSHNFTYEDYNKSLRAVALTLLGRELLPNERLTSQDGFKVYETRAKNDDRFRRGLGETQELF